MKQGRAPRWLPLAIVGVTAAFSLVPVLFIGPRFGPLWAGLTISAPRDSMSVAIDLVVLAIAVVAALIAIGLPRVGGTVLLLLCVLAALTFSGLVTLGILSAAIAAFLSVRPVVQESTPAPAAPDSGRVAAVVRQVQYGKPVSDTRVREALAELDGLQAAGAIDSESFAEYSATLRSQVAAGSPT